ncbi:MAG TPA: c-type cytochrome [Acidimicrobiales bacterium]|nr:c-type cytochrome [Acidimicrobiales bacterium]
MLALPVLAALGVGMAAWAGAAAPAGAVGAAEDEGEEVGVEGDPLGYVIDVDALDDPQSIADGRALYLTGCVSCHGADGSGAPGGPPLIGAGAASAHFYLTTGRMPHTGEPDEQAVRKDPAYRPGQIEDLVAYVASLGEGPEIPEIDLGEADVPEGGDLYRGNCAACHSAAGAGGALSYGGYAPSLDQATPVQVYEAMRIGPGQMPVFGPAAFSEEEVTSIVAYVETLQELGNPGGFALGRVGPIAEGFVAILIGAGAAVLAAFLIGGRAAGLHGRGGQGLTSAGEDG